MGIWRDGLARACSLMVALSLAVGCVAPTAQPGQPAAEEAAGNGDKTKVV